MQFAIDSLLRAGDLMLVTLGPSTVYALVRFPNLAQTEYATVGARSRPVRAPPRRRSVDAHPIGQAFPPRAQGA